MGIQGLLPFLRKASRPSNIKDFAGCTVAIDSYCWLHKGAFSCADKLGTGQETTQYVYYCMKYVNFLLSCGIKPIMVFDGCRLPSKKGVEKARQERREVNRKKAKQLLREGKNAEAKEYLQRSIDITPKMALELMKTCRSKGVDCIVAPYEADAQLAFLSQSGIAQIIITEDSDLVLFGCEKIMFKMDFVGNGLLVERTNLATAMDLRPDVFTFDKFRYMCILAGCDYLPSLPGIGLGKACKLFKISRQTDMKMMLRKLPTNLKMSNLTVTEEYIDGFIKADNTFLYQLVYDPMLRKLKPLHSYPPEINPEELGYAGQPFPADRALQIALGNIDLYTNEKIAHFDPDAQQAKSNSWDKKQPHQLSIWDKNYLPFNRSGQTTKKLMVAKFQDTPSTKGKEVVVKASFPKVAKPVPVAPENNVSDCDLLDMYNELENVEPAPKRQKVEIFESKIKSPKNCLEELEFESNDFVVADIETPKRSPLKSPNHQVEPEVKPSPKKSPEKKKTPKNIFAKNQNSKKEKFQLNASKACKSRFFKDAEPLRKTAFGEALEEELGSVKVEGPEEKFSLKDIKLEVKSPEKSVKAPVKPSQSPPEDCKSAVKQSLKQAFGFRRLDSPSPMLHGTSPQTSKPFKPVFSSKNSRSGSIDSLSQKSLSLSQRSLSQKSLNDSQVSVDSEIFNNNSDYSDYDSSFSVTPSQSLSLSESPLHKAASSYFKKTSPPSKTASKSPSSELKLKAKPGNLKRKCMDITSMFKRASKKTFQYSTTTPSQSSQLSTTPDLPSLPDVLDEV